MAVCCFGCKKVLRWFKSGSVSEEPLTWSFCVSITIKMVKWPEYSTRKMAAVPTMFTHSFGLLFYMKCQLNTDLFCGIPVKPMIELKRVQSVKSESKLKVENYFR